MRDSYASLSGTAGGPIEILSKRLGYSTSAVTRYLGVHTSRGKAAAEAFGQLVGGLDRVSASN